MDAHMHDMDDDRQAPAQPEYSRNVMSQDGQTSACDTDGDRVAAGDAHGDCRAPSCHRQERTAGYCPKHYQQIRRHGRLTPEREYQRRGRSCDVDGCERAQIAKGLCFRHYQQIRRYGRLTPERERAYGRTGCRVEGCAEPHSSRGYCKRHYMSEFYLPRKQSRELAAGRVAA